jgi:hypothetical protein
MLSAVQTCYFLEPIISTDDFQDVRNVKVAEIVGLNITGHAITERQAERLLATGVHHFLFDGRLIRTPEV